MVGRVAGRIAFEVNESDRSAPPSDEALVLAAQADRAEFAALYLRYITPIYRFCYRRLGDRARAEDATSAVFERAMNALPRFKTGSFRAWLFTIARNTVTDLHRANRSDQDLDAAWYVADSRPGPEELSVDAADAAWVRDMLTKLSPDQRQVVELRLSGLTDIEIAQVLGKSHGSVRTVQYRALQKLRSLFQAEASAHQQTEGHHATPQTR
jgi:RNA polymerase sigma-70 factor (ECF subfamily)